MANVHSMGYVMNARNIIIFYLLYFLFTCLTLYFLLINIFGGVLEFGESEYDYTFTVIGDPQDYLSMSQELTTKICAIRVNGSETCKQFESEDDMLDWVEDKINEVED